MKSSCFGFLQEIPEVLKSNLSNLKWGAKNSTVVSPNSMNPKTEAQSSTVEDQKSGQGEKTVASKTPSPGKSLLELYEQRAQNLRIFNVAELKSATSNFSPELKIGEGGFGSVYRGFIRPADGSGERILVAVKRLNRNGLQGHKEWVAEVHLLGIADHPNVVKLIGYCAVDGERGMQRFLVYELMPNRSLEDHLFNRVLPVLPWDKRLQVALGTAHGLAYLHGELEVQIIFRDFKVSNVLLDMDFNPKLSDFGLAREGPSGGRTHVTTDIVGTAGYAAPEYIQTGHLTAKSDVWSFGVVLYELLTGRRSMTRGRPRREKKLLEWVKEYPADSKKFHMIIDPRLGNQYSLPAAQRIGKLADNCLAKFPKNRPQMSKVVEILIEIIKISKHGDSINLNVQPPESDSVDSVGKSDKDGESDCKDGAPDYARGRLTHMTRLRKENGHAFGRRRFVMMSQEQQQQLEHRQHLQHQWQRHHHHEQQQQQQQQQQMQEQ